MSKGYVPHGFAMMRLTDPPSPETAKQYAHDVIDAIVEYNATQDRVSKYIKGYTIVEGGPTSIPAYSTLQDVYRLTDYSNFKREMEWALDDRWIDIANLTDWPRPVPVVRIRSDTVRFATSLPDFLLRWHEEEDWQRSMLENGYIGGVHWGKQAIKDAVDEVELRNPGKKLIPYPGSTLFIDGIKHVGAYAVLTDLRTQAFVAQECVRIAQQLRCEHVYIEGKGHDSEDVGDGPQQLKLRRPNIRYWLAPGLAVPGEPGAYTAGWRQSIAGIVAQGLTCITGDTWAGRFPDDEFGEVPGQYDLIDDMSKQKLFRAAAPAQSYVPKPTRSPKVEAAGYEFDPFDSAWFDGV